MVEFQITSYGMSALDVVIRLALAAVMGGFVGLERATRRQVSGMRTFALLCLGSALTMIANIYIAAMFGLNDPTRIPAAAIGSIGFLGVGTIFVAGRGQVRGMTTAASLWTVSALGIAIGAGLYLCSITSVILIIFINHILVAISHYQESVNREIVFYAEIKKGDSLKDFLKFLQNSGYKISSIEKNSRDVLFEDAIGVKVQLNFRKRKSHAEFLQTVNSLEGVYYLEEI